MASNLTFYFETYIFSVATRLHMRNSVILSEMLEDDLCAIIFELEYVVNVPISVNILNTVKKKVKIKFCE
jgi:hypothetical protein